MCRRLTRRSAALELSVAEEWKRANDPTGFQDYRVETSVAFDDNGRAVPVDPAVAEAARVALIQEWRTEQAGAADVVAADAEGARSRADLTEAQVMIAEADRLDRSNDAAIATAAVAPVDPRDLSDTADELDRRAGEYECDADNGGTPTQTPGELRELAVDARAQVALYRDDSAAQAPAQASAASTADGRASAAQAEGEIAYDSAERRAHTAAAMRS